MEIQTDTAIPDIASLHQKRANGTDRFWTNDDFGHLERVAPPEIAWATRLAALTGTPQRRPNSPSVVRRSRKFNRIHDPEVQEIGCHTHPHGPSVTVGQNPETSSHSSDQ